MSDLVTQIKNLQRAKPAFKTAWTTHCDESLGGMYDPARHGDDELQAFLDWWNAEGEGASAGPHDALVQEVKQIQRSGPEAKAAWVEHVATTASPGVHDPNKHDDEMLQAFVDWWLAEGAHTCGGGGAAVPGGGVKRAPPAGGGGGGGAHHTRLVDQIKAIQRSGPEGKQAWSDHCTTELGGVCDPRRHEVEVLQAFVTWWSEEGGGGELPAAAGGMPPEDLVQQVKNLQRSSPESKEAWSQYCQQHLGGVCDPSRHDAATLQAFLAEQGVGGGYSPGGPIRPVARPAAGGAAAAAAPGATHVNFIKMGAALSPKFKTAWAQYCSLYGQGFNNPSKYDEAFIREFADYAAGLLQADLGAAAPAPAAAAQAPKRVLTPSQPAGGPAKKKLTVKKKIADEIVRLNKEVGFAMQLRLPAVAAALSEVEESIALDILKSLETQADVEDPNELVVSMCQLSSGSQAEAADE